MNEFEIKQELENVLSSVRNICTDSSYIDERLCEIEDLIMNLINEL